MDRTGHAVALVRLYLLRAVALFFAIDGLFSKLPGVIHPDPASRGIIASLLAGLWVSSFLAVRFPLRMMPIFLFELVWKTLWLIDYGAPQWLAGTGSPRLGRDLFEIGFFPLPIALIIPWGYVWRRFVKEPADRPSEEISRLRLTLVRAAFLIAAIAGCVFVLPGVIRPDPAARGMLESMIAGLWVCAFLGLRYPLRMLPILLFAFVSATVWLIDYGLPRGQFGSDALAIGGAAVVIALATPWGHVWRRYVREPAERWR
jgi:hypothetical protein